jgi:hypothetical protein
MLSRIATQKAAEHVSQAVLDSVARLKTSRAAGPVLATRSAGTGKFGLARIDPPGGVLRRAQTASSHTPNRNPKVCHSTNTPRARSVDGDLPRHRIGAWMIVEGGSDNRGEE